MPHSQTGLPWVPSRVGVASRLLLAFLGISGFALIAAGVAILSFREIGEVLERVTERRVPAALASQEVSRQAERIVSAAPALLSAATSDEHAARSQNIRSEMQTLSALLAGLERGGVDSVALGSMQSAASRLRTNLELLDKLVAERIILSIRKRSSLRSALDVHSESQRLLTPWLQIVDDEIAQLYRAVNDPAVDVDQRAAGGVRLGNLNLSFRSLQQVQFIITFVSDRLQQIAATEDVGSARVHVFRIQQALAEARRMNAAFDPKLQPLLGAKLDDFRAHVEGADSIPELRAQELAVIAQATRHLGENAVLSKDLTGAVDRLVLIAKRDIAQATEDTRSVQAFSSTVLIAAVALSLVSSILIVWLYVGRSIASRLTALSEGMLAIAGGRLEAQVAVAGQRRDRRDGPGGRDLPPQRY